MADLRGSAHGRNAALAHRALDLLSAALDGLGRRVVLFRYGDLVFVTFGLFAALGAFVTLAWLGVILLGQGLAPELFAVFTLSGSLVVVAASWLLAQLFDYRLLLANPRAALRRPVFISWGGILGIFIVLGLFAPVSGFSALLLLDALARSVPLGHALGRLGCLSYGCCFGRPTSLRLAITYRNPSAKAVRVGGLQHVRLHPAAFYEAVLGIGIVVVTNAAAVLGAPRGVPAALGMILYGLGRFGIEFVRNNDGRIVRGLLSLNHLLSLALAGVGFIAWPVLHHAAQATPVISWTMASAAVPWLVPGVVPACLLIFVGFSLHRGRVGAWEPVRVSTAHRKRTRRASMVTRRAATHN
ncbi:MAG: prolipoprotein diacylglyceryl transferase [Candidatus Binatia bacterium]